MPQTIPEGTLVTTPVSEPAWFTISVRPFGMKPEPWRAVPEHWRATTTSEGVSTSTFVSVASMTGGVSSGIVVYASLAIAIGRDTGSTTSARRRCALQPSAIRPSAPTRSTQASVKSPIESE